MLFGKLQVALGILERLAHGDNPGEAGFPCPLQHGGPVRVEDRIAQMGVTVDQSLRRHSAIMVPEESSSVPGKRLAWTELH